MLERSDLAAIGQTTQQLADEAFTAP